ncbi:MAG: hypothetical protein ABSC42_16985 [Tepidisphaeraceae bacterium]|jgi:hypothetical protein
MQWITRALLAILYFVLMPVTWLTRRNHRAHLQLDDPGTASYWLVRKADAGRDSYFSEASTVEGAPAPREGLESGPRIGGGSPLLATMLAIIAGWYAPPRRPIAGEGRPSMADREQGVPDEIYTLW